MKVEVVAVERLTSDPENARKHSEKNLDAIRASLKEFGQRRPLVVANGANGSLVVIAGNGTLEAAKSLGWTEVAITRVPRDWDYHRARAYAIADNRTAELASWDDDVLASQLLELDANGWELATVGFENLDPDGAEPEEPKPFEPKPSECPRCGFAWKKDELGRIVEVGGGNDGSSG